MTVSSIDDPLGFAAPLTLTAKKLLQELFVEERSLYGMTSSPILIVNDGKVAKRTPTSRTHDRPSRR